MAPAAATARRARCRRPRCRALASPHERRARRTACRARATAGRRSDRPCGRRRGSSNRRGTTSTEMPWSRHVRDAGEQLLVTRPAERDHHAIDAMQLATARRDHPGCRGGEVRTHRCCARRRRRSRSGQPELVVLHDAPHQPLRHMARADDERPVAETRSPVGLHAGQRARNARDDRQAEAGAQCSCRGMRRRHRLQEEEHGPETRAADQQQRGASVIPLAHRRRSSTA